MITGLTMPANRHFIPIKEDRLAETLATYQEQFGDMVALDQGLKDDDLGRGRVQSVYQDCEWGMLRNHRLEMSFEGTPTDGTLDFKRSHSPQGKPFSDRAIDCVEEQHWHISRGRVEALTVVRSRSGGDAYLLVADPAHPETSGISTWKI